LVASRQAVDQAEKNAAGASPGLRLLATSPDVELRARLRALLTSATGSNGLSASQLFNWRRLAREGRLGEAAAATRFAAAFVADEGSLSSAVSLPEQLKAPETPACSARAEVVPGRIEIVLNCGHRVVVEGVDATALARVLAVLVRR